MWFKDTGKPLLFVDYDDNGKLFINPAAVDLLTTFKEPIAIIGAVGTQGDGKSFTLNQFLHRNDGFKIGGIYPCTKGMWLWDTLLLHKASGQKFLFLDCEGFDRHTKTGIARRHLFYLSLLLCSIVIHTQINPYIRSESIARLKFLTRVTTEIGVRETQEEGSSDFRSVFPTFIWLIRDFVGNIQTSDQRFQEALMEKDKIGKLIKELFPIIHCCTLPRPMYEESYLGKLDRVRSCNMRPIYKEEREKFQEFVLEKTKVKMVDDMVMTGPMLLGVTREIINAFNNDTVPVISSIWKHVHDQETHTKEEEDDDKVVKRRKN